MNFRRTKAAALAGLLTLTAALAACSSDGGGDDDGGGFDPGAPTLVVSAGPGSGSDTLARQITALLSEEGLTDGEWPVENVDGGAGAAAMGYLHENEGNDELIAIGTLGWVSTPLELGDAAITVKDLTPIARLITEPMVMAVADDSPYESLTDFVEAAESGEQLVQVGGQVGSINDLARQQFAEETGVEWSYLPVESGGERIPALIRGDADMMFGSPADFVGQTVDDGGDVRIMATIGNERTELFPDAPTHVEEGYDFEIGLAYRGLMGPPGMSDEAVTYYQDLAEEFLETAAWQQNAAEFGYTSDFLPAGQYSAFLEENTAQLAEMTD